VNNRALRAEQWLNNLRLKKQKKKKTKKQKTKTDKNKETGEWTGRDRSMHFTLKKHSRSPASSFPLSP
jgi:hypothetical protein